MQGEGKSEVAVESVEDRNDHSENIHPPQVVCQKLDENGFTTFCMAQTAVESTLAVAFVQILYGGIGEDFVIDAATVGQYVVRLSMIWLAGDDLRI